MMLGVFVNRSRGGVTNFALLVNAVVISVFVPVSIEGGHFHAAAYAEGVAGVRAVSIPGGVVGGARPPVRRITPRAADCPAPLSVLPEDVMAALVGGPERGVAGVDMASSAVQLASLSTAASVAGTQGAVGAMISPLVQQMNAVAQCVQRGDDAGAVAAALPTLASSPHSHESRLLLDQIDALIYTTSLEQLQAAHGALETGAPAASAPEGLARCLVGFRLAQLLEASGDDLQSRAVYAQVASLSSALLAAHANAPEVYRLALLCRESLSLSGESVDVAVAPPGTLAAWCLDALETDREPSWDMLACAEAKYGLLAAWHDEMRRAEVQGALSARVSEACALAQTAVWAHPMSPVQTRIVPLYFDVLSRLDRAGRAARIVALTRETEEAPSSLSVWMMRLFLYREHMWHLYDRATGALILLDAFDDLAQGHVDAALKSPEVSARDKARLEYYLGYAKFNRGWEEGAVHHYDRALAHDTSDVILDTALYARAFALEAVYDYEGAHDLAAQEYWRYLERHAYGRAADYAIFALGRVHERAEDLDGAQYFFDYLADRYPDSDLAAPARRAAAEAREDARFAVARAGSGGAEAQLCGPVALRKWLALAGVDVSLDRLALLSGADAEGTSMSGLIEAARVFGLELTGVQSTRGRSLEAPFIAFVNGDHFVLVREVSATGALVDDSHHVAPEWMTHEVFNGFWDGKALVHVSQAARASELALEGLIGAKGGSDPLPDPNNAECKNNESCPPCPVSPPAGGPGGGIGGGPGGGPGMPPGWMAQYNESPGFGAPGPGGPSTGPTNPSKCSSGYNPNVLLFQVSLETVASDLSFRTRGGTRMHFTRVFINQFGYKRGYFSWYSADKPYRNNIGEGWNHNYNIHLRVSEHMGAVQFIDEMGNPKTYTLDSEDTSYAYYRRRVTAEHEADERAYKGHAWEEGVLLTRDMSLGTWTMHLPDGREYGFSAATAWPERYARLLYMANESGEEITFDYDGLGRLTHVYAPSGDGRYMQFYYSGGGYRIVKAEIRLGSQPLESVFYDYDLEVNLTGVHRGNPQNPANDLHLYTYGNDANVPGSYYLASMTDADGVTTAMAYGYASFGQWGVMSNELTITRGGLLKTHYARSTTSAQVIVQNLDANDAPLSKIRYGGDWYNANISNVDFYIDPVGASYQRWSYAYDSETHFLTQVNRPSNNSGGVTWYEQYTYTPEGKFASVARNAPGAPNGRLTTTFAYDAATGLLLTGRTDPDGLTTEYGYDTYGRLVQVTHPSLGVNGVQYTYDAQGNRASVEDPLGNITTFSHDARGNMTSTTNALNQTTTFTYDDLGRVLTVTDPLNNVTEYEYVSLGCGCGGMGKLAKMKDPTGAETEFDYDAAGNMVLTTDALGRMVAYEYDAMNRLAAIEEPAGSNLRTTFTYNSLGHLVSTTDVMNRTTAMTYNHMGRITTQTDAVGTVSYAYTAAGLLSAVTDELGRVTSYVYDAGLRRLWEVNALFKYRRVFYDAAGRVSKVGAGSAGSSSPVEFFYDAGTGLLSRTRYWSGAVYHDADYTYDAAGRLTRMDDWYDGVVGLRYGYDALGRVTSITDYDLARELTYTHDAAGRISSMTDHHGQTTTYTWTARGQLASLAAQGGQTWTFAYNALGQRTQYTHPNDTRTEYAYDTRNRLTGILHKDATTDAVLDAFLYTLDDGGGITRLEHGDGSYWQYAYDGRQRLTQALRRDNQNALLQVHGYGYDDADNMTQRLRYRVPQNIYDIWDFTYNAGNEQVSMTLNSGTPETRTYDAWGRLATRAQGSSSASYVYRYGSRLYQSTTNFSGETSAVYRYGGDGKLRERETIDETARYWYDAGWNAIRETGSLTAGVNVFEPGAAVGRRLAKFLGSVPFHAYHDHLGSVRRWRLPNKNSARVIEYDPYGNIYAQSGVYTTMPRIFALHEYDTATRHFRAPYRNYHPIMTRWTTPDPLGMIDGPNGYAYVRGNPVYNLDVLGLACGPGVIGDLGWFDQCPGMGTTFKPCCEKHDDCYGSCTPRMDCEKDFYECMRNQCESEVRDAWQKIYCLLCAATYVALTSYFGEAFYDPPEDCCE